MTEVCDGDSDELRCSVCGLTYSQLRTGFTFEDVYQMFWVGSEDPKDWKYKRRHTVLGKWHEIKLDMWAEHVYLCEESVSCENS